MKLFLLFWILIFGSDTKDKLKEINRPDPCETIKPPPWCKNKEEEE